MIDDRNHKAVVALMNLRTDQLKRSHAYKMHQKACKWVHKYNLPWRVSMDYLKRFDLTSGVVLINECYPLPGYPITELIHITLADIANNPACIEILPDGKKKLKPQALDTLPPDLADVIEEHNRKYRPWDLETAAGRDSWEREFAHFLDNYDFDSFSCWEMFGTSDLPESELYARKRYYKDVLQRYRSAKSSYRANEPPYLAEYADTYTTRKYFVDIG